MDDQCRTCKKVKPVTEFQKDRQKPTGRRPYCKECSAKASNEYYHNNKDKVFAKSQRHKQEQKLALIEYKGSKCFDCGLSFPPYVYHFDHRDPLEKSFGIGQRKGHSIYDLKKEVEKCDLVCANCHAVRTHNNHEIIGLKISLGHARRKSAVA
jgi:hypothetical protein